MYLFIRLEFRRPGTCLLKMYIDLMASTGFDSWPRPVLIFEEGPINCVSVCFSLLSDSGLTFGDLTALQSPAPPGPCRALARNYMLRGLLVCQGPLSVLLKISTSKRAHIQSY